MDNNSDFLNYMKSLTEAPKESRQFNYFEIKRPLTTVEEKPIGPFSATVKLDQDRSCTLVPK
jgi:hypothetical protein